MTKQLALIRDLIIRMERMRGSIDQDSLVDVRDFAEFVFQRIRNAKVYSAADAREVCLLYRDWFSETGDVLDCLKNHKIGADTLQEMHDTVYKFDYEAQIEQADALVKDSKQFLMEFRNQQPTLKGRL